jgi:hypothetical protein
MLAAAKSAQLPAFADDSGLVVDARWRSRFIRALGRPDKDFMAA